MRRSFIALILAGLVLAGLTYFWHRPVRPGAGDLSAWAARAQAQDWTVRANAGEAEAQFLVGVGLIRTNLVKMIDRVPCLSAIPLIGKKFFEQTSYALDNQISQDQRAEAQQWIKKAAAQGFAPAAAAEKLFGGDDR